MNRILAIMLCLLTFAWGGRAANAPKAEDPFKAAKQALKTGKNIEAAEKAMVAHAQKSDTRPSERARAYNMAAQLAQKTISKENEKHYLKQPYDTARFFNSMQNVYEYIYRCDSIEAQPDESGRIRTPHRKDNRQMLARYRRNLLAGGNWMMKRRRWGEAFRIFDSYCKSDVQALQRDTMRYRIALWATNCAYANSDMRGLLRYVDEGIKQGSDVPRLIEYKSRAQLALGDTASWLNTLEDGVRGYPGHKFFFVSATNYLRAHNKQSEVLKLARYVLRSCPEEKMYLHVLGCAYYETGQMDSCIVVADEVLRLDPNYTDAYLNKGTAWVRKAEAAEVKATTREERAAAAEMYRQALEPLSEYRRVHPQETKVWGHLLYKVFYTLNMGEELEELERTIK